MDSAMREGKAEVPATQVGGGLSSNLSRSFAHRNSRGYIYYLTESKSANLCSGASFMHCTVTKQGIKTSEKTFQRQADTFRQQSCEALPVRISRDAVLVGARERQAAHVHARTRVHAVSIADVPSRERRGRIRVCVRDLRERPGHRRRGLRRNLSCRRHAGGANTRRSCCDRRCTTRCSIGT